MSEPLAAFLNVATCLVMTVGLKRCFSGSQTNVLPKEDTLRSWFWWMLGAGALCGMSGLVRAGALLLPVSFAILIVLSSSVPWRRCFWSVVALMLGTFLVIAPWAIRNRLVLDRWIFVSTNGGSTFWGANNALVARPGEHWGSWVSTSHVDRNRKEKEVWTLKNEADRDRREWQLGFEFLRKNPRLIPLLVVGKLYRLLTPFAHSANRVYVAVVALGEIGLLPATLAGMIIFLRESEVRRGFIPVNSQLLSLLGTTLVFYGSERFRMPYEPFMAIYAAMALTALWSRRSERKENRGP